MTELETKPPCKNCGSKAVVKYGTYNNIQRWWCKSCRRKFKGDDALFHMKTSANQITSALNMYYSGMSLKDISLYLNQEYDYRPSKSVVYDWVDKYTQRAISHFRDYKPELGDIWVADETVIEVDGKNLWLFDIIDLKTRFLIASRLTYHRGTRDAQALMEKARKVASKAPKRVLTDALRSYLDGIELTFGADTEHKRSKPFSKVDSTNMIERWHSTIKERTKVMRGLKDFETATQFIDGFVAYYNYFRPHESLGEKTPAEAAKVKYDTKNWADLTRIPSSKIRVTNYETKEVIQQGIPPRVKEALGMSPVRFKPDGTPILRRHRGIWR